MFRDSSNYLATTVTFFPLIPAYLIAHPSSSISDCLWSEPKGDRCMTTVSVVVSSQHGFSRLLTHDSFQYRYATPRIPLRRAHH